MAYRYPRRVKDLPSFDLDFEDEPNVTKDANTSNQNSIKDERISRNNNKENDYATNQSNNSYRFNHLLHSRIFPKRSCELPTLESDSEEEYSDKKDNLNCAILNESFSISPSKSDLSDTPCRKTCNDANISDNLSFLLRFDKMALSVSKANVLVDKTPANKTANEHAKQLTSHQTQAVPIHPNASNITGNTNSLANDTQFATPQVRTFSVHRRQGVLSSVGTQKKRSDMLNEFRSQKVLFQTPMALSRAPVSCLSNDSLALSLCDTLLDSTPNTAEKVADALREKSAVSNAGPKKSLEAAFTANAVQEVNPVPCPSSKQQSQNVLLINNVAYSIHQMLGSGGSSSVYSARRISDGKQCALKVVDLMGDPAVIEGYLNETKLLAKLQGNPSVVTLYEYQLLQKESRLFVVMEQGDSDLNKILRAYTTDLPSYVLMNYLYQILQAVNYIHQNGVIHSDLKPANFLMVNDRLKLIDFGIASNIAVDSTSIIKSSQAGTFNYISPEALTDTSTGSSPSNQPKIKLSTKSDVWSLGCILYLFLYKRTPFSHIKLDHAKVLAISDPKHKIDFPPLKPYYANMLLQMVQMCLRHNPKERPSCAELLSFPFEMVIPLQNLKFS